MALQVRVVPFDNRVMALTRASDKQQMNVMHNIALSVCERQSECGVVYVCRIC